MTTPKVGRPRPRRSPGWKSGDILRAVALGIGLFYGLKLLYAASPIVLIAFLGLLLGLVLAGFADRMERYRVPRSVSAVGVVLLVYGTLIGGGFLAAPMIQEQAGSLREQLPRAVEQIQSQLGRLDGLFSGAGSQTVSDSGTTTDSVQASGEQRASGRDSATVDSTEQQSGAASTATTSQRPSSHSQLSSGIAGFVGPFLSSSASALAGIFIVTFIALYIAIDPATYREGLLHLVPRGRRKRVREVMQATTKVLQQWFTAQLIAMAVVGAITTVGLLLLGIEGALVLGIIAAVLEFVPFVGPFIAAVPAIAVAMVDSPEKAVAVGALYLIIQQLEATLVTPLVMKNGLELPPILTILAQGIMGVVFGLLGVLVAVPLLAAIIVPIKMLYVQDVVGDQVPVFEGQE